MWDCYERYCFENNEDVVEDLCRRVRLSVGSHIGRHNPDFSQWGRNMIRVVLRLLPLVVVALLSAAVLWQTWHLLDWAHTLYVASGDGSVSGYLRWHAYVYVEWFFDTDFGWIIE